MFFLLFIILQCNPSGSWNQNYLLFLPEDGEDDQGVGEMTPVDSLEEEAGSDYSLGQELSPLSCSFKKKSRIRILGRGYALRCKSSVAIDKCQFRKIELKVKRHFHEIRWLIPIVDVDDFNWISELSGPREGKFILWRRIWVRMMAELFLSIR